MEGIAQDVRLAVRMLSKHLPSTALMILTLAVGIGAITAGLTAAKAWLVNPYPFPEPDRLVRLEARHITQGVGAHYRDFLDWRERNRVFEEIAIIASRDSVLTGRIETERATSYVATAGAVRVLGVGPVRGRFFNEEEDGPGGVRVALVSETAWRGRFVGRPDILGSVALIDGQPHTIIGVMSDRAVIPGMSRPDFWVPLREDPAAPRVGQQYYSLLARLKPDVTLAQARDDMAAIARALEQAYPESNQGWGVVLTSAQAFIRDKARTPLAAAFAIAGCLMLLVTTNVAGMLLARASGRTREIAVRAALGASRWRIVRQLLTESVLLAVMGGALSVVVAQWFIQITRSVVPNRGLDVTLRVDVPILLATLAFSLLIGVASGLSPALRCRKADLDAALKGLHRANARRSRTRFLSGLVVAQVALSMALLVAGGLLTKDFLHLLTVDTGVKTDRVLSFRLDLPRRRYASAEQRAELARQVVERLRVAPGVESAAAVSALPMSGYKTEARFAEGARAILNATTPTYFATLGIPLLRGRDFDERDRIGAPAVVIISELLALRYFSGQDPIGAHITLADRAYIVVGVVGTVRHEGPWREAVPEIYVPFAQSPTAEMFVAVRSSGDPAGMALAIRQSVRDLDAALLVDQLRTMEQVVQDSLLQPRLLARGLLAFALFGLALAAIGLYGVMAYSTAQRTREIAIRVAVGATSGQVLRLVLWNGLRLAGVGLVLGVPLALALSQLLKTVLATTSTHDIAVFTSVWFGLLAVALTATYIPARRVTRVEPLAALRCE